MTSYLRRGMLPLLLLYVMLLKCAAQEPRLELVFRDGHVDDFHGGAATVPDVSYSVVGLGEESPLFGNGTPEGGCYNRMVSVRVTSPAEE